MNKRALLTNFFFTKYTGSELHVLEMARLLEKRGYEVTVAVFYKAYPLLEKAGTLHIVDVLNEELECVDYDIVIAQHYPVLDYLCCKYELSYKKLIISKLSVIHPIEHLPVCTKEADLILCVSDECVDEVQRVIGENEKVRVFKNSVSEQFFQAYNAQETARELKKIAIISNHVPKELQEFSKIVKDEYVVDYIGMQYSPRLVDAELLKEYDLVITIGRTVQQCFAAGVPVYVYDYFGGPGYINDDNFDLAEKNNFSGRGGFGAKTALELKADIEINYQKNLLHLEKLNAIAQKEYSYDLNFERIYQELGPEEEWSGKSMNFYAGAEKQRISLYSRVSLACELEKKYLSQLYIDYGDGFNEKDSMWWSVCEKYKITKIIKLDKKVKKLRLDPCNEPAMAFVYGIYINGKAKEEFTNKKENFFDFDPQFVIELSEEEQNAENLVIELVYNFKTYDWEDTQAVHNKENAELKYQLHVSGERIKGLEETLEVSNEHIKELNEHIKELNEHSKELEETIEAVKEYYKMTPRNIMRRILNRFRK